MKTGDNILAALVLLIAILSVPFFLWTLLGVVLVGGGAGTEAERMSAIGVVLLVVGLSLPVVAIGSLIAAHNKHVAGQSPTAVLKFAVYYAPLAFAAILWGFM
jgi:hypothetical protein